MKFASIGEITEKMLELEKKHNLLSWEIKGVKIYQVVRYLIYINALSSNIEQKERNTFAKTGLAKKIFNKASRLKNFFFYNPLHDNEKSDTLLFESSRKQKINNEYVDPFTTSVKINLLNSNSKFTVYQSSYFFDRLAERQKNTKHLDYFFLSASIKAKSYKLDFTPGETEVINRYGNELVSELNLTLNFFQLVKKQLILFFILSDYYSKLLEIKNPKQIYIVNFCDKAALVNECKKRKILVTDIQHGFVSSKDIVYHYPDSAENKLEYFPDKFLAWSESWLGGCKLPLSKENIEFTENYSLKAETEKYKDVPKKPEKIVILSQDTLTEQILERIYPTVKNNPSFSFFYKPHPNEYSFIESIKKYSELSNLSNFYTIDVKAGLYPHLADAKYAVGVYTTALIEALYFNCEVLILDLPGSEMMSNLMESGRVKSFDKLLLS